MNSDVSPSRLDPVDGMVRMIGAAQARKPDMQRMQQPQCVHMAVGGTEACPRHLRADLRQHFFDLPVSEDLIIEAFHSRLVVQAIERIGAVFQLVLGEHEMKTAGITKADVETGLARERLRQLRPPL